MDKFELSRYGLLQDIKDKTSYTINQHSITAKDHVRDPGITMSADTTFTLHLNK